VFQELGEGVLRRRYPSLDQNIGVVIGEEGVLVVDTRSTYTEADEVISELRQLTDKPVRWVVNTHWHWDHVLGNARFAPAEIWGHERTRLMLLSHPGQTKESAKHWLGPETHREIDEVDVLAPGMTFSNRVSLDIGRSVTLSHHGLGHTDADIVVVVEGSGVGFLGDLVEEGAPPSFGDSYPLAWPDTLRAAMGEPIELVVPGHGDIVDRGFVDNQIGELALIADLASRCMAGDLQVETASHIGPYPAEVMTVALERVFEAE
jgi:glyoxylase-like metal-dependent hydrolase (beta-lactamase superfamily II)